MWSYPISVNVIGIFRFGCDVRNLNQHLAQPDIAFAGLATQPFAATFLVARTHARPGDQMFGAREASQVTPDLGDDNFSRSLADAWYRIEQLNRRLVFL